MHSCNGQLFIQFHCDWRAYRAYCDASHLVMVCLIAHDELEDPSPDRWWKLCPGRSGAVFERLKARPLGGVDHGRFDHRRGRVISAEIGTSILRNATTAPTIGHLDLLFSLTDLFAWAS